MRSWTLRRFIATSGWTFIVDALVAHIPHLMSSAADAFQVRGLYVLIVVCAGAASEFPTPPQGAWRWGYSPGGRSSTGPPPEKIERVVTNTQATEGWQPPSSAMLCPGDGGLATPSPAHGAAHFLDQAQLRERQRSPSPQCPWRRGPRLNRRDKNRTGRGP